MQNDPPPPYPGPPPPYSEQPQSAGRSTVRESQHQRQQERTQANRTANSTSQQFHIHTVPPPQTRLFVPPLPFPTGNTCPICGVGVVGIRLNFFCVIYILIMSVIFFPVGLLALCCIPFAAENVCSNCRRVF